MRVVRLTLHPATAWSRHHLSLCLSGPGISSLWLTVCLHQFSHVTMNPQWGTADAEIKIPSVENPELTNALPLKPGVCQNIAMHASPTTRNFFLVLILTLQVHSPSFIPNPLPAVFVLAAFSVDRTVSRTVIPLLICSLITCVLTSGIIILNVWFVSRWAYAFDGTLKSKN